MKNEKLLHALDKVDERFITASSPENTKKTKNTKVNAWVKWGAMAACLCLVITGVAMWGNLGQQEKIPEAGVGVVSEDSGGVWPEGVDPVIASLAVIPAGVDLLDVADAVSISISEEDARAVEGLGGYLPAVLPDGCRYGKAAHYRTMMKDGTEYQMLRVTYEIGEASVPVSVPENADGPENAQMASEMTGNTAFLWMVLGHRPDTDLPVYQSEEVSASLIEQQEGGVFYIDYDGIYVGVEQLEISAADLFAVIESIG